MNWHFKNQLVTEWTFSIWTEKIRICLIWFLPRLEWRRHLITFYCALGLGIGAWFWYAVPQTPSTSFLYLLIIVSVVGNIFLLWSYLSINFNANAISKIILMIVTLSSSGVLAGVTEMKLRRPLIENEGLYLVEGWIEKLEIRPGRRDRATIRVHAISGYSDSEKPKFVRMTLFKDQALQIGQPIFIKSHLRQPSTKSLRNDGPWARNAFFAQIGGEGYAYGKARTSMLEHRVTIKSRIQKIRNNVARAINEDFPTQRGAMMTALLIGDRSGLTYETKERLAQAGVAHIIAISGLHMALVGGLAYFIFISMLAACPPIALRINTKRHAAIYAIIVAFLYLVFSGAAVSATRAFVMLSVAMGAIIFNRNAISINNIGIAALIILFSMPQAVMQPGFHMSFLATLCLVSLYENWPRNYVRPMANGVISYLQRIKDYISALISSSLVASAATMPSAVYFFSRATPFGLIGNLLILPLFSMVLMPSLLMSVIFSQFGLHKFFLSIADHCLAYILAVTEFIQHIPHKSAILVPLPSISYGLQLVAIILIALNPSKNWKFGAVAVALSFFSWAITPEPYLWSNGQTMIGGRAVVIDSHKADFAAQRVLDRMIAQHVDPKNFDLSEYLKRTDSLVIYCDPETCLNHDSLRKERIALLRSPIKFEELCMTVDYLILLQDMELVFDQSQANCHAQLIFAETKTPVLIQRRWNGKLKISYPAALSQRWLNR